jgi:hypothetical protein
MVMDNRLLRPVASGTPPFALVTISGERLVTIPGIFLRTIQNG